MVFFTFGMAEFSSSLTSIAVAQLLSMAGIDRIHSSAHACLVEITEKYMVTLATMTKNASSHCLHSQAHSFDSLVAFNQWQINPQSLVEYVETVRELKTKKDKIEVFRFPRAEPKELPSS